MRPTHSSPGFSFASAFLAATLLATGALFWSACNMIPGMGGTKLWVFVSNYGDNTVSVIDGRTDREVKTIEVGGSPQGMALYAGGPLLAVANSRGPSVTLIDPVKQEALPGDIRVGYLPSDVAISADGKILVANSYNDQTITIIDLPTRTPIGEPMHFEKKPGRLRFGPNGRLFALLRDGDGMLAVIDLATRKVEAMIPVGPFPTDFGFTPDSKRLFAASYDGQRVTVVDTTTLEALDSYRLPTGYGLVMHPSRPLLYSMLSFDDEVVAFDYEAKREVARLATGEYPTYSAITPDGRFLYVVDEDSDNVIKFDTATNTAVHKIAVGSQPGAAVVFSE